ncbi:MAG: polysaccharide biosynthesis tyrosine autokinase [Deltaproteobacteria bacterium]|nr:polysaccharide biosynthesis tyrosine autokinase [Deltaproteobacteria bacterium]
MATPTQTPPSGFADGGMLSIDPKGLLRAIVRRKWWIVASTLVVGGAVAAGTLRQPKIYESAAQIIVDPVVPKVLAEDTMIDNLTEQSRAERAFYNTQYQIIKSRAVLRDVVSRLKLSESAEFLRDYVIVAEPGEPREKALEDVLLQIVTVAPELQSRIVRLVVQDQDPERAARIANAVADAYINYSLERRLSTTRGASKWLDERVEEFGRKLENAEKALHGFRQDHMLVSVSLEDRQNMISTSLSKLSEKLVENQTQLIDLEARRRVLEEQRAKEGRSVEADPRVAKSEVISEYKRTLAELNKRRAELSTRYGELHPNMVSVDKEIAETTSRMHEEIGLIVRSMDTEIAGLKASEISLKAAMEEEKQRALELNTLGLDYSKLTRDFGTTKKMYESLLQRQSEASLSGLLESNFVRWHQTAEVQPIPVRPSVPKNAALGLVLGLILGLTLAIGSVLLDNTVHTQVDIEEVLRLPFLGILPSIQEENRDERSRGGPVVAPTTRDMYIGLNPKSTVAECARSIRTNLLFLGTDRPMKRLLLTSAGPAEGKSTTAIAMALTMAQAGNRVLLVDTDLRKPRLHRTFGVSGERGLTSLLLDASDLTDAIKSTDVVGLDILPCGPLPPNPAEILHTERFANLVKQLDQKYDRIVFDSPPVHAVTDAVILSQIADGTIFVVKASKTAKDSVRKAARQLADVNARILGVVLNDVDLEEGGYGYSYYYYHRYGYSYGSEGEKSAGA